MMPIPKILLVVTGIETDSANGTDISEISSSTMLTSTLSTTTPKIFVDEFPPSGRQVDSSGPDEFSGSGESSESGESSGSFESSDSMESSRSDNAIDGEQN